MKIFAPFLYAFLAGLVVQQVSANSASPDPFVAQQSDGTPVTLKVNGDEFDNFVTDLDGYTVLQTERNGDYVYAVQGPQGKLVTTGVKVGQARPPGLAKGVRPSPAALAESCQDKLCGDIQSHGNRRSLGEGRRLFQGDVKNLVVLIRFSDHVDRPLPTESDILTLMNSDTPDATLCPTGSVWNVMSENSYGALNLQSVVAPWVTVPNTEAYYANTGSGLTTRTHDLIRDALNGVDPYVDFSLFDSDGNGRIDAITFLHSGYAAEFGGTDSYGGTQEDRIWSHKWGFSPPWTSIEGVTVSTYNISPSVWGRSGSAIGRIGVIAHELGHFFGLPDLYDGSGGSGIGSFCLMANSWGFDGTQWYPPVMSAWARLQVGWAEADTLAQDGVYSIQAAEVATGAVQIYRIDHNFPSGEYLLIENRQKIGYDAKMPDAGLAIFHIDDTASYTTEGHPGQTGWPGNGAHYRVAMLQADGLYQLEKGNNRGSSNDLFYQGGAANELLPSQEVATGPFPNTDSYKSGIVIQTDVRILDISSAGEQMTFTYSMNGASTPPPTDPPTNPPTPTPLPTKFPTAAPTPPPTDPPSNAPTPTPLPTKTPTSQPTPPPTEPPLEFTKYFCQKGAPLGSMCSESGISPCTIGSACGNGGKKCWELLCDGSVPTDAPLSPTDAPVSSPTTASCFVWGDSCDTDSQCCSTKCRGGSCK